MSTLVTKEISKSYGGRLVVHDVSVYVEQGEVVGLLGPNGAGKHSTTFYMIVGLISPESGSILLDGEDITSLPMYKRAGRGISYLPQEASVFRQALTGGRKSNGHGLGDSAACGPGSGRPERSGPKLIDQLGLEKVRRSRGLYALRRRSAAASKIARGSLVISPSFSLIG